MVVMDPSGDIAVQQRNLIVFATVLMLLIIIPVITLTLVFAWKYRESNTEAAYTPEWHHSTRLELVIWAAPLAIIIALGSVTWIGLVDRRMAWVPRSTVNPEVATVGWEYSVIGKTTPVTVWVPSVTLRVTESLPAEVTEVV